MVNSCKSTQAVVTQSKIWIISFHCHVKCKQEALTVNPLGQTLEYARNQQNMPILNRTHLLRKQTNKHFTCNAYKPQKNKFKVGIHTLMATKLGELSTSTGAFGKNWICPSSLASNWKMTSSCPTFVKLNLFPSKGCRTLSTRNSVGLFLR